MYTRKNEYIPLPNFIYPRHSLVSALKEELDFEGGNKGQLSVKPVKGQLSVKPVRNCASDFGKNIQTTYGT